MEALLSYFSVLFGGRLELTDQGLPPGRCVLKWEVGQCGRQLPAPITGGLSCLTEAKPKSIDAEHGEVLGRLPPPPYPCI